MVSLKCSWLTAFKTQNWVYVAVWLKADASFFYCNDVSAINTLVVVRTTPQPTIVVGSQHIVIINGPALMKCKDNPLHISIAMMSHEDIQRLMVQYCTRVRELDQRLIAWNMHKQSDVHLWWCPMSKSCIRSIATALHELDIQSTSLIAQECANLIDT